MYAYKVRPMVEMELKAVVAAKNETRTPKDTVSLLIERYGKRDAERMVAMLVNAVSLHDGRIYDGVREWATSIRRAPTHDELREIEVYGVDSWIHSAHVNDIGLAMKNYKGA